MMYGMSPDDLRARVDANLALSAVYLTAQGPDTYGKAVD